MNDRIPPHCSTFRFEGNPLIFAATTGHVYILNATAGFLWDTLSSEPDLNQLAEKYTDHFGIPLPTAHKDIAETLANLESLGLLMSQSPSNAAEHPLDERPEDRLEQPATIFITE